MSAARIRGRATARWILAVIFIGVGIVHLTQPELLLPIMPDWVPWPRGVILGTGICEIAGAVAMLTGSLRQIAGIALTLYAFCVFPANIKQALENVPLGHLQLGWWYHAPRLALEPVLIWWILFASELIDWPFGRPAT